MSVVSIEVGVDNLVWVYGDVTYTSEMAEKLATGFVDVTMVEIFIGADSSALIERWGDEWDISVDVPSGTVVESREKPSRKDIHFEGQESVSITLVEWSTPTLYVNHWK